MKEPITPTMVMDARDERERAALADQTADTILRAIEAGAVVYSPGHKRIPGKYAACVRCSYPADHPVHI